jgi:hypothetical protein
MVANISQDEDAHMNDTLLLTYVIIVKNLRVIQYQSIKN